MDRPRRTPRRAAFLAATLVALVGLTACGTGPVGPRAAATVDGHRIPASKVLDLLDAQATYLRTLSKDAASGASAKESLAALLGDGDDTWNSQDGATTLDAFVVQQVVLGELDRRGEKITTDDRAGARSAISSQVGGEAELKKIPALILDFAIERGAAQTALGRVAAKAGPDREARLKTLWEQSRKERPVCVRIIVGADEAALAPVKARIDAGEDFGTVASETSSDPETAAAGGHLGCNTADLAAQAFEIDALRTAKVGDVFGPVLLAGSDGSKQAYLVQVSSTTGPTFDQARAGLEQQLEQSSGSASDEFLATLLKKADISVDPRFGTWNEDKAAVLPPTTPQL